MRTARAIRLHEVEYQDKIKGSVNQLKGALKEKAGQASGDADLRDRGTAEKVGGHVQKKVGDVKKVFGK